MSTERDARTSTERDVRTSTERDVRTSTERDASTSTERDAHWYAAEGIAAAVAHAMLVQPGRDDVMAAIERDDWPRALAAASECLRWIALCREVLGGGSAARTGLEVDLLIAGGGRPGPPAAPPVPREAGRSAAPDPADPLEAIRSMTPSTVVTRADAERAAAAVAAADAGLRAELPLRMPVRRTPTGNQPAAETVSQLERLRHRLGLPLFDWEAWIG
ncbi:hypothetical protein ACH35V_38520 [Actinomadura sp. 1N219]|uniref:hypothetical protein n=1 Tax=Actinomadura sp. 1N219 TaxID=3375152 RepID=UPI0037A9A459